MVVGVVRNSVIRGLSRSLLAILAVLSAVTMNAVAPAKAADMDSEQFDRLFNEVSNWGRWGEDDELGTLNLITPEKRRSAAGLVRAGRTVSLALELNKIADPWNIHPFKHVVNLAEMAGHQVAGDVYTIDLHGLVHTHLDSLPHFAHKGYFYNGVPYEEAKASGAARLGVENIGKNGIVSRGVLVDMPHFLGVEYLKPGYAITADDIVAWEKQHGVTIGAGDVLLIRTGRWAKLAQEGHWNFLEAAAGVHVSLASWLRQRDVAVLGSDGVSDTAPSAVEGMAMPVHVLALVALGLPLLDNLDLEVLAEESQRSGRPTFLFVASPMRVPGGTGAPINPLAIF